MKKALVWTAFLALASLMAGGPVQAGTITAALPAEPAGLDPHQDLDPAAWTFIYPC